jgi:UDP-N-acetylmuramoyl-tripeptide--D-alanyl-D-alanine ligase
MEQTTNMALIITAIGATPVHIEFFKSKEHLVEEKSGLIKTLKKDGILILNADDEDVLAMKSKTKQLIVTYGFKEGADIVGSGDSILYSDDGVPEGIIFRVDEQGNSMPVEIEGVFGRNHVYASLASLAVASALKLNTLTAIDALKNYDVPAGRMRLLKGINDSIIIDDTYNSSPLACESALKTIKEIKMKGRRIAVLGDMLELGKHTVEAHKNIGKIAKDIVEILIVVGPRAKSIEEGALEEGMKQENIFEFLNSNEAGEFVKSFVKTGDIVLVKGSQGVRMEKVTEAMLLDKKNKEKLLVRQDSEWKKK